MARRIPTVKAVTMIGTKFIHWGLALFIFGLVIGLRKISASKNAPR